MKGKLKSLLILALFIAVTTVSCGKKDEPGSNMEQVKKPVISLPGDTYTGTQNVTIICDTDGAEIRYTTDGTNPSKTNGTVYTSAILINSSMTLKVIAYKDGMSNSDIASAVYVIDLPYVIDPVFSLTSGTYNTVQSVTISCGTTGASIYYTTNGSDPNQTTGTLYTGAISVNSSQTIKAIAYKSGKTTSQIITVNYVIDLGTVAKPSFNLGAGTYNNNQNVTISCATSGASIKYTLDGNDPSPSNGTDYTGSISISSSATLKAIAYKTGFTNSQIASAAYTLVAADPSISLASGTYTGTKSVTISESTTGASIKYTLDGNDPSPSNGTDYTGSISISSSATLKAIAFKAGYTNSQIITRNYAIVLNPPTAISASTNLEGKITVSWSSVAGATGYKIYRSTSSSSGYSLQATINDGAATQCDDNISASSVATYYYKISTLSSGGEGSQSSSYATGIVYPVSTQLTLGSFMDGNISAASEEKWYFFNTTAGNDYKISWKDTSDKATGDTYTGDVVVQAYKSDRTAFYTYSGNQVDYGYKGCSLPVKADGSKIYLKVTSYNKSASFIGTFAVKAYTPVLSAPTAYASKGTHYSFIERQVQAVAGASKYRIYHSTTNSFPLNANCNMGTNCAEILSADFITTLSGMSQGTNVYFWFVAVNGNNEESVATTTYGYTSNTIGDDWEPNDSSANAESITINKAYASSAPLWLWASIHKDTDQDWYAVTIQSGYEGTYHFNRKDAGSTSAKVNMTLYQGDGTTEITSGTDTNGLVSTLAAGTYYLKVTKGSSLGDYELDIYKD